MVAQQSNPTGVADKPYRILSLDGGGMRGFYTARLLARLLTHFEKERGVGPLDLGKGFDAVAGTSTGAILGFAIAAGKHPTEVAQLYKDHGAAIFPRRFPKLSLNPIELYRFVRLYYTANANKTALEDRLRAVFGDETMQQLWDRRRLVVTIPAVSIETYGPKVFKTPHLPDLTHDRAVRVRDVCLSSGAAPLFFPLHQVGIADGYFRDDVFVDGGLWANNPSLVGLLEAIAVISAAGPNRPIEIYSFGTCSGTVDRSHLFSNAAGGLKTWRLGKDITELALSTSANSMAFMTKLLASTLTKQGWSVSFTRIPDPEMTSQQQAAIGLDRADDAAITTMEQLSATNETRILSDIRNHQSEASRRLADILNSIPTLTTK